MRKVVRKEKELYLIWIEYLRRSKLYKEFCNLIALKKKNPSALIPAKFKDIHWVSLAKTFGPIHSDHWNFPEWWDAHQERLKKGDVFLQDSIVRKILKIPEPQQKGQVQDYSDNIGSHIDICISTFKFYNNGKEPTLHEMKEEIVKQLKTGTLSDRIILQIDPQGRSTAFLLKDIGKFIDDKRKLSKAVALREIKAQKYLTTTAERPNLNALKKYLEVYDLKMKGLKCREIVKLISKTRKQGKQYDEGDLIRDCEYHNQCAKEIIANIERGLPLGFPGPHGKTKKVRGLTFRRAVRNKMTGSISQ